MNPINQHMSADTAESLFRAGYEAAQKDEAKPAYSIGLDPAGDAWEECELRPPLSTPSPSVSEDLYEAIKHGDDDHRTWLREAIAAFYAGKPVPPARGGGRKEARIRELEAQLAAATSESVSEDDAALIEQVFASVKEEVAEGVGEWRTCSGCHETVDGYDDGFYPFSKAFNCKLGGGCSDCGGIGAIWDTADYSDIGASLSTRRTGDVREALFRAGYEAAQQDERKPGYSIGLDPAGDAWEECELRGALSPTQGRRRG